MRPHACLLALLVLPAVARAQSIGFGVRAGYSFSSAFTGLSGRSGMLEGPEVTVDVPLGLHLPVHGVGGLQVYFSPSIFSSTAGWNSSDFQGTVYRLIGSARVNVPASPLFVRIGAGYSYASPSQGAFASVSAYETQLGFGLAVLKSLPALNVSADVTYHQSSSAQIRGWTIGLSARF